MAENSIDLSKINLKYQNKPGVNKSKKLIVSEEDYAQKNEEALRKNVFLNVAKENGKWSIDKDESAQILADAKKFAGDDSIFTAAEMKEMFTEWGYFDQRTDADTETQEEWFKRGVEDFTNYMALAFDVDLTGFHVDKAVQEVTFDGSETSSNPPASAQEEVLGTDIIKQLEDAQTRVNDLTAEIAKADELTPLTINENSELLPIITDEDGNKSVKAVRDSGGNSVYGILNTIYGYNSMNKEQKSALLTAFMDANPETFPPADSGLSRQERLDARKTITVGLELNLPETTAYLQSQELKTAQKELDQLNSQVGLYKDQYQEGDAIKRETNEDGSAVQTKYAADGTTPVSSSTTVNGLKVSQEDYKDGVLSTLYNYTYDENNNLTEFNVFDCNTYTNKQQKYSYETGERVLDSIVVQKYSDINKTLLQSETTYGSDGTTMTGKKTWEYNGYEVKETQYAADGTTPVSSVTTIDGIKVASESYDSNGEITQSCAYSYDENGNLAESSTFDHKNFSNTIQKYSLYDGKRVLDSVVVEQYSDAQKSKLESVTSYAADGTTVTGKSVYSTTEYNGQSYEVETEYQPSPANTVVMTYTDASGNIAFEDTLECYDDPIANPDNGAVKKYIAKDYTAGTITTTEYNEDGTIKSAVTTDFDGNVQDTPSNGNGNEGVGAAPDSDSSESDGSSSIPDSDSSGSGSSVSSTSYTKDELLALGSDDKQGDTFAKYLDKKNLDVNTATTEELDAALNEYNGLIEKKNEFLELYEKCKSDPVLKEKLAKKYNLTDTDKDGGTAEMTFDELYKWVNDVGAFRTSNERGTEAYDKDFDERVASALDQMNTMAKSEFDKIAGDYSKSDLRKLGLEDKQGDSFAKYLDKKNLDIDKATPEELKAAVEEYNDLIEKKNEFFDLYEKCKSDPVLKEKLAKKYNLTDSDESGGTAEMTLEQLYYWVNNVGAFRTSWEMGTEAYDKDFDERVGSAVDQMSTMVDSEYTKIVDDYTKSDLRKFGSEDKQGDTFIKYLEKSNLDIDTATPDELKSALEEYNKLIEKKNEFLELYEKCKSDPALKEKLSKKYDLTDTDEDKGTAKMTLDDLYSWVNDVGAFKTSGERGTKAYNKDFDERVASAIEQMNEFF